MIVKYRSQLLGIVLAISVAYTPDTWSQELDEIIVTAQRRAQDLQDVAISVSAFTRDSVKDLGWTDVTLVANQSPNLDVKYAWGNSMPIYTIRGVGMNSFQASDTASVALFIDDVFQTSIATMGAFLYGYGANRDVARAAGDFVRPKHQRRCCELPDARSQPRAKLGLCPCGLREV